MSRLGVRRVFETGVDRVVAGRLLLAHTVVGRCPRWPARAERPVSSGAGTFN